MNYSNFHSHTQYCDGKATAEEIVKRAIELKFESLGFSGHAPVPHGEEWCMTFESLPEYKKHILELKEKYKNDITLYLGLEIDYIPGITKSFDWYMNEYDLDYNIGSIHIVKVPEVDKYWFIDGPKKGYLNGLKELFNNDIRKATKAFYEQSMEMIETQKPQVIGHIDKVIMHSYSDLISPNSNWHWDLLKTTLDTAKKHDSIVEINTRGIYSGKYPFTYPDNKAIEYCHKNNIRLMVNSDSHHPNDLDKEFDNTFNYLKNIGVKEIWIFKENKWISAEI